MSATAETPRAAAPPRPPSPIVAIAGALLSSALDAVLLACALGGVAPFLAHRRALALLAIWTIGALVLAWTRPVRARAGTRRSGDPLRMAALLLLPTLAAPAAALGERLALWPLTGGTVRAVFGLALVATGLGVRIVAMRRLGSRFDPTVAILQDHVLETGGLYSRVRHPGYAGALLAALGGALVFDSLFGLPLVGLMALALAARVRDEERALEAHFGDAFRAYRARTGAFLPRLGR